MAVTAELFTKGMLALVNKEIDWNSDAIRVALVTVDYVADYNQDAQDYFDDITHEVAAGGGYNAGGELLTVKTQTTAAHVLTCSAATLTWPGSTITARGAIIYDNQTGVPATSPLIGFVDFGADVVSTAGDFTITWHVNGIFTITVDS